MTQKYEIVYIFDSALEEQEVNQHLEKFHEILKSPEHPEPITGMAHWGKRTLAYPIKRKEIGHYVVAHVETDTQLLGEFERLVKLDEAVLRYLVVINEGLPVTRIDQPDLAGEAEVSDDDLDEVDETPNIKETPRRVNDEATEAAAEERQVASIDEGGE